jgi:DNA adenine methylase
MEFNTPLRYPGGKGKLTDFIKLIFVENNLIGGHYVEPYAGGAGIAINLLFHGYVSCIHLNDLNQSVHAFWYSVLNQPDELCKAIYDVDVSMDEWHRQKAVLTNPSGHSLLALGFSTFFLNRTNRSGILKGGVIGGKNQDGHWKLDARFNKIDLINRIERIALHGTKIRLYNFDAVNFIESIVPTLPKKSLIYLDPPYYVKGKGLYQDHYIHEDHVGIAKLVKNGIKRPWIVSYDYAPEILDIYKGVKNITYGISYSAQDRYRGAEVMFFSDRLEIPDVENPSKLKSA